MRVFYPSAHKRSKLPAAAFSAEPTEASATKETSVFLTRDREFYRAFWQLSCMLVLQNLISFGVNLTDNVMLGGYSQAALAGAATVNQIQFIFQQLTMGIGEGLVVLAAQYWGAGRTGPVKKLISVAFWCGMLTGAVMFAAVSISPMSLLRVFTNDPAILSEGLRYLAVMRWTYLIFMASSVLLSGMRSVETVRITFYISICTFVLNLGFNWVFIFGNLGAPRMGATGSAVSTLISRAAELGAAVWYVALRDKKLRLRPRDFISLDRMLAGDFLRVCLPVAVTYGLWGVATALQTAILGHMEADAIAANSVATTFYQVLKTVSIGASSAAAVLMAKTVGRGRMEKVREYSRTLQMLFIATGLMTSILLFVLRGPVLGLYVLTPATRRLADSFFLVLCVTCIGTAYEMPALGGIIRGGGDTKFVLWNDIVSIWGIVLPVSFLAAFVWRLPPVAVVALLNSDQIFKCGIAAFKVNRYRWVKPLTRPAGRSPEPLR